MRTAIDPATKDEIRALTADGLRQCGTGKAVANALSIHPSAASRLRSGDPTGPKVLAKAGEVVWALGINYPRTSPFPATAAFRVLARKSLMTGADVGNLMLRYREWEAVEFDLFLSLYRLNRDGADMAAKAALRHRLMETQEELAALASEIAGREMGS